MDIRTNWDSVRKEERENGRWEGVLGQELLKGLYHFLSRYQKDKAKIKKTACCYLNTGNIGREDGLLTFPESFPEEGILKLSLGNE